MGCGASTGKKYQAGPEEPVKQESAKTALAEETVPGKPEAVTPTGAQERPQQEAEEVRPAEQAVVVEAAAEVVAEVPAVTEASPAAELLKEPVQEAQESLAAEAIMAEAGDKDVRKEHPGEAEAALAEAEEVLPDEEVPHVHSVSDSALLRYEEELASKPFNASSALLELDRSAGASLGVSVRSAETVLLITQVMPIGLFSAWNAEHPERQVQPGSCIIQVNGLSGSADQMLEELQKEMALRVEVDRTGRDVRAAVTSAGMAHWCREQTQALYEKHDQAGLASLDRRMETYKNRELAFYRTLSKKFGEEPKDPELCANSLEDISL